MREEPLQIENATKQVREVTLIEWIGAVYSVARHKPSEKGKTMSISMNTTSSRHMVHRRGNFCLEIRKRLARAVERLGLRFSAPIIKWAEQYELQRREAQRCELGYEARKRELLIALRQRISEKHTKNN